MSEKININITGEANDIIIREGEALKLMPPEIINIQGTIDAPSRYLIAKKKSLKEIESTLFVSVNEGKIKFVSDEKNYYKQTVTGALLKSKALKEIGVNDINIFYSDKSLAKFIRQHIFYFTDKGKAEDLINKLMKFSAKIQTDIKNDADLKGNVSRAFERVVNTGLPECIDITCKIYEGLPAETFTANLCVEADASSLKFYFDSPSLFILEENMKTECLEKEARIFEDWGCAVIYI
jgi:hypothetical protein